MPRGNKPNVYLSCKECDMQNYTVQGPKEGKLALNKFCSTCNASTEHGSGKKIRHSTT